MDRPAREARTREIVAARLDGKGYVQIAGEYGISRQAVRGLVRRFLARTGIAIARKQAKVR